MVAITTRATTPARTKTRPLAFVCMTAASRRRSFRSRGTLADAARPGTAHVHTHALELGPGAEDCDPVAGRHGMVAPRAAGHLAAVDSASPPRGRGCRSDPGTSRCGLLSSSTAASTTANRSPPSSRSCDALPRHASTNDGAAKAATSSTLPGPVTRSRARPTEGLASWTTRRTSGRASRTRNAISRVASSLVSAQITATARSRPASVSPSPRCALRWMCGTPQPRRPGPDRRSGSSSTTTTGDAAQVQTAPPCAARLL